MVVPGLAAGEGAGRGGGPRRGVPRRGLRLALGRLLDVPRDEPGHRGAGRARARRPRTATSRAARAAARAPISSARRWPPRPPSRATSSTSGSGHESRSASSRARVSVLDRDDVDTDQIIPKQFLKRVERTGFGEFLFYDWAKEPGWDLPANPILAAGRNFGCGSSREHAPWALEDYGFGRSIAPSFADIFYSNCTKIGLLPVVLAEDDVRGADGGRPRRGRPRRAGGALRRARGLVRDRPRDQAAAARGARRHRRDARSRPTRSTGTSASGSGPARSRPRWHEPRDWDAGTYDRVSDAQSSGRRRCSSGCAGRRRDGAGRGLRLRAGHPAAARRLPRGTSSRWTPRRRWSSTRARRCGERVDGAPGGPGRAGARGAGRRRLLERRLPLDAGPRRGCSSVSTRR